MLLSFSYRAKDGVDFSKYGFERIKVISIVVEREYKLDIT